METSKMLFIISHILFFCGILSLFIALEQLNRKDRSSVNVSMSMVCLTGGLIQLFFGAYIIKMPLKYPITAFPFFTILFLIGPVQVWHNMAFFRPTQDLSFQQKALHLFPALQGMIMDFYFLFQPTGYKMEAILAVYQEPGLTFFKIPFVLGTVHVLCYMLYILWVEVNSIWKNKDVPRIVYTPPSIHVIIIISAGLMIVGFLLCNLYLIGFGALLISMIMCFIFIFYSRYLTIFQLMGAEVKKTRYQRSLLKGVNTDAIRERLVDIMEMEQAYVDFELNLKVLADRLQITPHQFSQFLNDTLNMDFRNFVNTYRIKEAEAQLITEPDKNILTICFDVGFSSKSAFYTAFKKQTGLTPSEYRIQKITPTA